MLMGIVVVLIVAIIGLIIYIISIDISVILHGKIHNRQLCKEKDCKVHRKQIMNHWKMFKKNLECTCNRCKGGTEKNEILCGLWQ